MAKAAAKSRAKRGGRKADQRTEDGPVLVAAGSEIAGLVLIPVIGEVLAVSAGVSLQLIVALAVALFGHQATSAVDSDASPLPARPTPLRIPSARWSRSRIEPGRSARPSPEGFSAASARGRSSWSLPALSSAGVWS